MGRIEFQILIIPFKITNSNQRLFSIFRREKEDYWQWIAGGGEDQESIIQAAKRESFEEAGINQNCRYIKLDSLSMIPITHFKSFAKREDIFVIPEYAFGQKSDKEGGVGYERGSSRYIAYNKNFS